MDSKTIFIIILLLVILAIIYRVMKSLELQGELTKGIAIKAGVAIPQQKKRLSLTELLQPRQKSEEEFDEETEDGEYEEEENNEEEETEEDSQDENVEEEEGDGEDEPQTSTLRVLRKEEDKKSSSHIESKMPTKKLDAKNKNLKGYEMIVELLKEKPLNAGDLKDKWREEFGDAPDAKITYSLNYAFDLNMVKKHLIGKRYIYGTPEMFEGDVMKEEFLPKENK